MKFSESRQSRRPGRFDSGTDVCQLTLAGTEGGGEELNKNKGVSSQKVPHLCPNSLPPGVVQRSGC